MSFKVISEAKRLSGKIALVRLEMNVPLKGKKIIDDSRLREAIPTLRYLERHKARIVIISHLGRPGGKKVASLSLKPIGYALGKLLRQPIQVLPLERGSKDIRYSTKKGIVLLENIRFYKGEDENDVGFSKQLAQLGDLYVNEAFATSHRKTASFVGVTKYLPAYAGFQLADEVKALEKVLKHGVKPVVAIIGGAKVADKLSVIEKLLPRVSAVLTGGGVANTFLAAKGYQVGKSLIDKDIIKEARRVLKKGKNKILLPIDVIVDKVGTKKHESMWRKVRDVKFGERIVDLGTNTTRLYAPFIKKAQTIFWSGPLGLTEEHKWSHGSLSLGRLVSARARGRAFVVIGGGETVSFFHQHKFWVDYTSLAGGAMLEFLAGEKLPGLEALKISK
jgi:phosphoglycerate kinase